MNKSKERDNEQEMMENISNQIMFIEVKRVINKELTKITLKLGTLAVVAGALQILTNGISSFIIVMLLIVKLHHQAIKDTTKILRSETLREEIDAIKRHTD